MSIPSNSILPNTIHEITPPCRLSADLRQATFAAHGAPSREPAAAPHQRAAASAPTLESTFSRINPPAPKLAPASASNPKSAFSRIIPMNPEPVAAPAPHPKSEFSRTNPSAPDPAPAPAPNHKSAFSRIIPMNPEPSRTNPPAAKPVPAPRHPPDQRAEEPVQAGPLSHPPPRSWHRPQVAERPRRCWAACQRDW
jgi:hypothetical protein